jgi:hypothetical protein
MLDLILPKLSDESLRAIRRENARHEIMALAGSAMVPEDLRDTGWAVVQAVNTYENWVKPSRKTKYGDNSIAVRQFDAAITGKGQDLTQRAISAVLASV